MNNNYNNINNNINSINANNNLNNNNGNVKVSSLKRMIKSKGFVTAVCAILAVAVLIIGYNIRINDATKPVAVPVAVRRLTAGHMITDEDIRTIEVPKSALSSDYYSNKAFIVGRYVNYDTTIPAGSMFYTDAVVNKDDLPDAALFNVPDGETIYYLTVNMLTSFTNSILPNRYIDIYISTKDGDKALVGKLLENVKILQVKTSDGQNVFEDSQTTRVPYVLIFSLPEELHLLMRDINAINNYSISASGSSGFSRIDIIPVPTNTYYKDGDEELKPTVTSQYIKDYILNLAAEVPEDIVVPLQ